MPPSRADGRHVSPSSASSTADAASFRLGAHPVAVPAGADPAAGGSDHRSSASTSSAPVALARQQAEAAVAVAEEGHYVAALVRFACTAPGQGPRASRRRTNRAAVPASRPSAMTAPSPAGVRSAPRRCVHSDAAPLSYRGRAAPCQATSKADPYVQQGRLRSVLVGVEVWSCAMCLILAGLLLHSFMRLLSVERGFNAQHVLTVALARPSARYADPDDRAALLQAMLERVEMLPGVVSAGATNGLTARWPVDGWNLVGRRHQPAAGRTSFRQQWFVSPDYFATLGVRLSAGRIFDDVDRLREPMVLVSSSTAERLWPGENPLGRRFRLAPRTRR